MNTGNYKENEKINKNEIRIEDDKLALEQFVLNDESNRNSQVLFHEVLKALIIKYNTLSEKERREELVFYLKDNHILLGNITKEIVQTYYNYESLFNNLMPGKAKMFREFTPKIDNNQNNKAFSANNNRNNINNLETFDNIFHNRQKEIKNNLNHYSFYFNGMYFESTDLEKFLKLIDDKYNVIDNDKKLISFLPRIIFFTKNYKKEKNKCENIEEKDFHGYSEIDCSFVLNGKKEVTIEEENITCFNKFDSTDKNFFFNTKNFVKLRIEKDNVVFFEVKSCNENAIDKENKTNILINFINKALQFVSYYEELNLIKKDQKIALIFLYNSSMYSHINNKNDRIKEAYKLIEDNKRIILYIAYFPPFLKFMGPYQRVMA